MYVRLIFLFIVISSFSEAFCQRKKLFDFNVGLTNSQVNKIYQDHQGFIWVGTADGLNRFDGIVFNSFDNDPDSRANLRTNYITTIAEDRERNLWIGQNDGLQKYNYQTESFVNMELFSSETNVHPFVTSVLEDRDGGVWIATSGYGVLKMNHDSGIVNHQNGLNSNLSSYYIRCLFQDSDGVIWIGTDDNGVNAYNPVTGENKVYSFNDEFANGYSFKEVSCIVEGNKGEIFIGTLKSGLVCINKTNGIITRINSSEDSNVPVKSLLFDSEKQLWVGTDGYGLKHFNKETSSLEDVSSSSTLFDFSKSKIHSILQDNVGNIWLGIYQKGLYLFSEEKNIFEDFGYRNFGDNNIGSSCVTAIGGMEDDVWIGTDGDGLYHLSKAYNKTSPVNLTNGRDNLNAKNILCLYDDQDKYLWIGSYLSGLIRMSKKDKSLKGYKKKLNDPESLVNDHVTDIVSYKKGQLLIATLGGGLCRFDMEGEIFRKGLALDDSLNKLLPGYINKLFKDADNNLWIGTYVGLFFVDEQRGVVRKFNEENGALPRNTVNTIMQDSKQNIWVGTYGGLVKINGHQQVVEVYDENRGLCDNTICAIGEDEWNQLWISTHNGLAKFDPVTETFVNYYSYDGIQSNEFSRNSVYQSKSKELYFGGINGVTQIKKNYPKYSLKVGKVVLTDFMSSNHRVNVGDKSGKHVVLSKSVVEADTANLMESDNIFSIGFTSLELANQPRISYEYKLDGFDDNWIRTTSFNRRATYTNLKHGTYNFLVRGVYKGHYSESRQLTIIIYPSWYKTVLAKIIWTILSFLFIYGFVLFYIGKVRYQHAEKVNELKMQFFMNISHEIKTPLSLIMDPLERLKKMHKDDKSVRLFRIMQQNANRMLNLVVQMMDVRKIEKGQMQLKFQQTNVFDFVSNMASSYEIVASNRDIDFKVYCRNKDLELWIDPANFEKIVMNLLSNAFKHTPSGGKIGIYISEDTQNEKNKINRDGVKIEVRDSGPGIAMSESERIFERFYQIHTVNDRAVGGTGIGLHLSRSLVEKHKGKIWVEKNPDGEGASFIVLIPKGKAHLPEKDLIAMETTVPVPSVYVAESENVKLSQSSKSSGSKEKETLMIIEDDDGIRDYLRAELSVFYRIVDFENGKVAYENLMDVRPDLIISDVMMPEMDGISFCKKVKSNVHTCHIPVILLTALNKEEDKFLGIETGADMYMTKPFRLDFLTIVIHNLLNNRKKLLQQVMVNEQPVNDKTELKSHNDLLMQKVMTVIKENISNGDLNVEMLADTIGISRVHLHRKVKELSGLTTKDYIKNIRMSQATYLLSTKKMNISEVAFEVGFNNLSHFSNSFKSYYGVSPSDYQQNQKEEEVV